MLCENISLNTIDFNFFYAVRILRKPFYNESRRGIMQNTLKFIKRIVINKNDTYFRVPSGLPLLLEYLCYLNITKTQKLINNFERKLKITSNLNYAVKYGIANTFLYYYESVDYSER